MTALSPTALAEGDVASGEEHPHLCDYLPWKDCDDWIPGFTILAHPSACEYLDWKDCDEYLEPWQSTDDHRPLLCNYIQAEVCDLPERLIEDLLSTERQNDPILCHYLGATFCDITEEPLKDLEVSS